MPDVRELWEYRHLLGALTARDIRVRYKQTLLGAAWALIRPLLTMVVFSLVFGRYAGLPSDGVPYPLFTYTALVPWALFATGVTQSSDSLVANAGVITKVYFPRLALPIAGLGVALVDFAVAASVLVLMAIGYGMVPGPAALAVLGLVPLTIVTALGTGLLLSAINVRFRDVGHAVPFLVQLWLFATPIAYPTSIVPESLHTVYAVNPMVTVVEGFRISLVGRGTLTPAMVAASVAAALGVTALGLAYFVRTERTFADLV